MQPPKTPGDLRKAIALTAAPSGAEPDEYRIADTIGAGFLARDRSGLPALLIPLDVLPASSGRRGGGFSLRASTRVDFRFQGRHWQQSAAILDCTNRDLADTFLVLAADIASRLQGPVTWPTVALLVEEWQALLARRGMLSAEQELGLWGELWIISNSADPDLLAAAWRGPDHDATDFFLNGRGLEVKASRRAHIHYVSQRQVDKPVGLHVAYCLSIWVGIDPSRGHTLPDLVASTLERMTDPAILLKRIAELGYSLADHEHYGTKWYVLEPPLWFKADDVPRVRVMDAGISHLRYQAILDIDKCLGPADSAELWRHFCVTEIGTTLDSGIR